MRTISMLFWSKARHNPDTGCWEWRGATNSNGYGILSPEKRGHRAGAKMSRAHRVSWELAHGPIPDGMCVLHHCDNPPCVNPAHLFLGTPADNAADRAAKGRNGRPAGSGNGNAKLTDADVLAIRVRHRAGLQGRGGPNSTGSLAREYGVGRTTVKRIIRRERWTHLVEREFVA